MRLGAAFAAFVCFSAFGSVRAETPGLVQDLVPRALPMPDIEPAAFAEVGFDKRCQALSEFLAAYASRYMPKASYQGQSCAEGYGLGGTRYDDTFLLGQRRYRIEVSPAPDNSLEAKLCDAKASPSVCGPVGDFRFQFAKDAAQTAGLFNQRRDLTQAFLAIAPAARHLLKTVTAYVAAKPERTTIYDMDYGDFARSLVAYSGGYPYTAGGSTVPVKFKLVPATANLATNGKVTFTETPDAGFMKCLHCGDLECLNQNVTYALHGRFFSLTNHGPKNRPEDATTLGWVVEGPTPMPPKGAPWVFACGVSRFSIEVDR